MATAKRKLTPKSTKKATPKKRTKSGSGVYATEHDFIIIAGGGLVVMVLVTLFIFGLF